MTDRPQRRRPTRKAPAYQEYASDMLADARFRCMSLSERGLLCSMRWQSWVSGRVPVDVATLARLVGATEEEIRRNLTPSVLSYFERVDQDEQTYFREPELAAYREHLEERRLQQIEAGKVGAEARWSGEKSGKDGDNDGKRYSVSRGDGHGALSRDELSRNERLTPLSINEEEDKQEYLNAFARVDD